MPIGSRVIANNAYGVTTDNPLTMGATVFNSLQLQLLPSIVSPSQYAVIILDPKRVFGEPEIVTVTSHTGFATDATIERAKYGTTARSHPVGTAWVHLEVNEDYVAIVTSSTAPSDPYVGQMTYETDTVSHRFYNGSIWNSRPPVGTLLQFAGSVAPQGYIFADGSTVSRTGVTAALFAVLGTTYGVGDGVTTFQLPDLSRRIPVGRNAADASFDVLGETGGEKLATLDASNIAQHSHNIQDFQHRHGENTHDHSVVNLPFVGVNANHIHGGTLGGGGQHDHQTTGPGQPVMVIAAGAGPFNVSPPGGDFVTFDVSGVARTSSITTHTHPFTFGDSGTLLQTAVTNQQAAFTGITATLVNKLNGGTTGSDATVTTTHNNLQPYITVNYIIKL